MLTVHIEKQLSHFLLDVQFNIDNEIAVLFGPSGSGKTTILNCISGLVKISGGRIALNGRVLVENGKSLVPVQRRKIGYLFQDYALFPHKTVWENIAYGMNEERFTRKLTEELKVGHLLDKYPHEISGGEKQRTALIRALATKPELLLLDEPFSALDEATKKRSWQQLLQMQSHWDIPVILVTHNEEEAEKLAHKIFRIDNGKIKQK